MKMTEDKLSYLAPEVRVLAINVEGVFAFSSKSDSDIEEVGVDEYADFWL